MISIVDYGLGNTLAFANTYKRLNIDASICTSPKQLSDANKIILPGVGSFDWAMARLNESGLRDVLDELVLEKKVPVIGICVGMQMMANRSEEGVTDGLGWIDGDVKRFDVSKLTQATHLPHMGWNDVIPEKRIHCSQAWSKMHASIFCTPTISHTITMNRYSHSQTMATSLPQLLIERISMVFSSIQRRVTTGGFVF